MNEKNSSLRLVLIYIVSCFIDEEIKTFTQIITYIAFWIF